MKKEKDVKESVKQRYGEIASKGLSCCSSSCSCSGGAVDQTEAVGYSKDEIGSVPEEAVMGLGCGNPSALAELKAGETVLDLGSGAGIDAFLAANRVGKNGKVIGVDMTPEMIKKANENAKKGNYNNVEFKLGEIENLPIEDNSIDVILSNCVINLSPDKPKVYREVFRVLKPGGRILISDIVTNGELPPEIKKNFEAWAACIAGGMEKGAYLNLIKEAGFKKIEIVKENVYDEPSLDEAIKGKIISIQLRAYK
jgi:SAM-dependent methyltransferase